MNGFFIITLNGFCGFMVGLALTKRNKDREEYYRELLRFCSLLMNNISYKADKIGEIILNADVNSLYLKKNLQEYEAYLDGQSFVFSQSLLSKSEAAAVKEFFLQIGRYDGETQLNDLRRQEKDFEQKYNEIKEKNSKQGNARVKLGLLAGLLVGILLI